MWRLTDVFDQIIGGHHQLWVPGMRGALHQEHSGAVSMLSSVTYMSFPLMLSCCLN